MSKTPTTFDFWYAVNNTEVVVPPTRHLETFGSTIINYALVSELMDSVGQVRVREGRLQAARPQIVTPSAYSKMILEGFGEQAEKYLEWLRDHEDHVHVLRYGYALKQESFSEEVVNDKLEAVLDRVKQDVSGRKDPFSAVVKGVDTPWDVCLVRLFWQVIQNSVQTNFREMAERKLFDMRDGIPAAVREEIEDAFKAASANPALVKSLGKLLQRHGVFDQFQDRFFALVKKT
ncbi:MAG: hypothetical protein PHR35_02230 [Kiritimatiellae bacterium]|nr:hypothetical protein [Kiritimatiellia bacterium]